ncbi:MAG: ABC transporter ATP-binding protein/permease [Lachnospiraceae bacterium]|nr:ABC transporter ATP-binding protein/permease [Lachnospiraceae bacterium]
MLELKNIIKNYPAGGEEVHALKGVSLQFRESEFVSILGPSGCGKTTMLNIIGGLDKYTDGDLVINGKSTKEYKARDWDAYRNHSIGFVFQTYNLIPHQNVLTNVELALTLSGVSKAERRKRAKEALEKVGLKDQMKKRPSEMSGGQMQRVAIARAIVNNPDIILADEPTGALDTETSIQVMDILKEIAKDRLVIMVTHNPDLANKYSTRIVRMLDGVITDDSAPLDDKEYAKELEAAKKKEVESHKTKKPSMSLWTAFGLSLKNLFTKKGRTILTSFAGSIGIIGIALIYATSNGATEFIDNVQEQTLSAYPITIQASTVDMSSLLTTFMGKAESTIQHDNDAIYQKNMIYELVNSLNTLESRENDLVSFKKYIEAERANPESEFKNALLGIQYTYNTNLKIYTKNLEGDIILSDASQIMTDMIKDFMGIDMSMMMSISQSSALGAQSNAFMENSAALWKEMLPGNDGDVINPVLKEQYDILYGNWPTAYNEIILFVDEHNELNDLTLYALGLKSKEEMDRNMEAVIKHEALEVKEQKWSYEDICNLEFKTVLPCDAYIYDEATGTYSDLRETTTGLKYLYDNGLSLKVCGIAKVSDNAIGVQENGHIGYTSLLTDYIIDHAKEADVVKAQLASKDTDVLTGLPFKGSDELTTEEKAAKFHEYVNSLDEEGRAALYTKIASTPSDELIDQTIQQTLSSLDKDTMLQQMIQGAIAQTGMKEEQIAGYLSNMSEEELTEMFKTSMKEQYLAQYSQQVKEQLASMSAAQLSQMLDMTLKTFSDEQCAVMFDDTMEFSPSNYDSILKSLCLVDKDNPSSINLFASSFANKDIIADTITAYNNTVDEIKEIRYTDIVGIMMSSVTTIINAITYVLIAFVAVSLIVSSIMIGVITLISVQERTKEIGILRAIGASKRNVSSMFNAETVIIGFTSGMLGVIVTYILCIPINAILHSVTGIENLSARLPIHVAAILVLISMLLTLIAGIIPSRSAAKKDPVVALRTE